MKEGQGSWWRGKGYLSPTVTFSSTWSICFPYARRLVKKHTSDAIKNECVIVYHCSYCKD